MKSGIRRAAAAPSRAATEASRAPASGRRSIDPTVLDATLIGVLAMLVAVIGSWRPDFWSDEEATLAAADRPLSGLVTMVTEQLDAVHGLYYALMQGWVAVAGTSEFALRFPSAVMVGVAAAGAVVLARMLADRTTSLIAGVITAALPAVTYAGMEARSYAGSLAVVTWLTVVLLVARRDGRRRFWVGYGLLGALAIALFLHNGLILVAHAATLLLLRARRRDLTGFGMAAVGAGLAAAPIVLLGYRQRGQIDWVPSIGRGTVLDILVVQWTRGAVVLAVVLWILVAVAVIRAVRRPGARDLVRVTLPWLLLPTTLVLAVSLATTPLYTPRYLVAGAPALALLAAAGIRAIPWRPASVVATAAVVALAIPTYLEQRSPDVYGTGWRQITALVQQNAAPGDAVLFNERTERPSHYTRGSLATHRDAFADYVDVALEESTATNGRLRDTLVEGIELVERLRDVDVLWVVWPSDLEFDDAMRDDLEAAGLREVALESGSIADLRHWVRPAD